ncbi:uncharacterized protein K460DRAFT_47589 [Cucurbitaria berberidis CBS 394.84]|uniref:Uncharacterized protein n=1 Tax=Cucurbitaria berberidis CBS 394.84 TaxID=1168544 RepID=A0A9P4GVJ8_9PLEO|nr:uncharacterized protein K460DRAFT_47589 [Cucurbitaria berberidis CBS 394.84]KAF1852145.1 hypothetical protein K460DRAFT_47589 [Cucurbitaria berberidis CBS 394.84]
MATCLTFRSDPPHSRSTTAGDIASPCGRSRPPLRCNPPLLQLVISHPLSTTQITSHQAVNAATRSRASCPPIVVFSTAPNSHVLHNGQTPRPTTAFLTPDRNPPCCAATVRRRLLPSVMCGGLSSSSRKQRQVRLALRLLGARPGQADYAAPR